MCMNVFIVFVDSLSSVESAVETALTSAGYTVDIATIQAPAVPAQVSGSWWLHKLFSKYPNVQTELKCWNCYHYVMQRSSIISFLLPDIVLLSFRFIFVFMFIAYVHDYIHDYEKDQVKPCCPFSAHNCRTNYSDSTSDNTRSHNRFRYNWSRDCSSWSSQLDHRCCCCLCPRGGRHCCRSRSATHQAVSWAQHEGPIFCYQFVRRMIEMSLQTIKISCFLRSCIIVTLFEIYPRVTEFKHLLPLPEISTISYKILPAHKSTCEYFRHKTDPW